MSGRRWLAVGAVAAVVGGTVGTAPIGARTQAKCNNSNPIVIGAIFSMTGTGAGLGKLAQQGASLAVHDVNAAGGWLGRCVKEVLADDQSSPTAAAQVARQLLDQDDVDFVVGPFLSSPTAVVLPLTNQAKVIQVIGSSALDYGDASKYPYTFRNEVNTNQIAESFLPFLKANHWTRVALYTFNSAFGTSLVSSIQNLLEPEGITITKTIVVNSGTPDVTPQLQEIKGTNPQAILAGVSTDPDEIALVKARNALGWDVPLLGLNSMSSSAVTGTFSTAEMKNVFSGQVYKTLTYAAGKKGPPTWPKARTFISHFARWIHAHGIKESVTQAAGSYDQVMLIGAAVTGTKSLDSDKIKRYLETHPYSGVRGKYVWNATRHDGPPLSDFVFALSKSLNNFGIVQRAPGQ